MIYDFDFEKFKIAGIDSHNELVDKFIAKAKEQEQQAQAEKQNQQLINAIKQSNTPSFSNIQNSQIVLNSPNSTISQQLAAIPKELQSTAIELFNCLNEIIKTNQKPKNFKQRFGDFITNNLDKLSFLGNLALQVLPLIV